MAALVGLAALVVVPAGAGAAVLYDQTDSGGSSFPSSDDYGASNVHTDQIADDFTVPARQTWQITQIDAPGFVFGSPPSTVNAFLYVNSGSLPGAELSHGTAISASRTPGGNYTVPLTGTAALQSGTYWVSVQQTGATYTTNDWFWQDRTVPAGNPAVFRNPGGGSTPACTNWTPMPTCFNDPTELGVLFRLSGHGLTLGKPRLNKKRGTAKLPVTVTDSGELALGGKGVVRQSSALATASVQVGAPGTVRMLIRATGKKRRRLNAIGRAKVNVTVIYMAVGSTAIAQSVRVKLKKKL